MDNAISHPHFFPNSRIAIITLGKKGSLVRFEGQVARVLPFPVDDHNVIDETGAGDCFTSVVLKALYTEPRTRWTMGHVMRVIMAGSYASAMIVQSPETRLNQSQMDTVSNYFLNLKS